MEEQNKVIPEQVQSSSSYISETRTNGNTESTFKKYLYNEVTLIIAIGAFLWGVFNFVASPQKQIQADFDKHSALQEQYQQMLIKEIQIIREGDLKDLKADLIENRNQIDKLTVEVTKLGTIIQERIPRIK